MSETPEQRIEELYRRLNVLKAERDDLNKKAQTWAERRNRIHEEIRKIRLLIRDLKQRRDSLNKEVKHLKALRKVELERRDEILEEIRELRKERNRIAAGKPPRSQSYLENQIKRIEWKIQTEPLPLDAERKLIDQIKILEAQLEVYRRIGSINNKIAELRKEADKLKAEALNYRSRILEISAESQEFHAKMLKRIEEAKELKAKADEMHQRYAENKEKVKAINLEIKKTLGEIRSIRELLKSEEEKERRRRESDLQRQTEEKALEKLKRGEKLTFDEFKILLEKGKI
ncbi:hypothetical protein CW704_01145 [Candidatus Bathyarchaeota archaeon]|nr:MAG: hypothetical protein CW704_01145 [Candidatus Bathyarchaeota archaeon]